MSLINVYNEWDPVEEIIVGNPAYACIPQKDKGFDIIAKAAPSDEFLHSSHTGVFPNWIIEETEEDIQIFIQELVKLGITVRRPNAINNDKNFKTLDWESDHYFCYCPRDVLLTFGQTIIETPNIFRSRYFETNSYKDILIDYMKSGSKWISAPKPRLLDEIYNENDKTRLALNNHEPVFDAANVIRAGRDLFYLISDSGNELGCQWLQNLLGDEFNIHPCYDLYSSIHIDSTVVLLKPGLVLINPARVNNDNLPPLLKQWDILVAPDMIESRYSDFGPSSSVWLGMNLLMLAPDLAVVDQHQLPLIKLLEKNGINVIPLRLRHGRTLGGGFHCITLDVRRKGQLEDYFS
jgi:glycine amidinotransferase